MVVNPATIQSPLRERVQSLPPRHQNTSRVPISATYNGPALLSTRAQRRQSVANDREAGNGSAWRSINRTNSQ